MNTWNDRLKALRKELDLEQVEFAALLGITREWVSKIENGQARVSELIQRKIVDQEGLARVKELHVEEPQANLRKSGDRAASRSAKVRAGMEGMVDTRFQPRSEPTARMCLDHFEHYLAKAVSEAGGVGYTWRLLQKHFPLDEFERDEKKGPS